jgi:hypothetical protein
VGVGGVAVHAEHGIGIVVSPADRLLIGTGTGTREGRVASKGGRDEIHLEDRSLRVWSKFRFILATRGGGISQL